MNFIWKSIKIQYKIIGFTIVFQETWSSCKGASGLSPDHGMPTLDYKWQRNHSHSRSFSSSHFDEVQRVIRYLHHIKHFVSLYLIVCSCSCCFFMPISFLFFKRIYFKYYVYWTIRQCFKIIIHVHFMWYF